MKKDEYKVYHAGDTEARWYRFKLFVFTLIIYSCLVAYVYEWLHVSLMVVIVSICVTRWLISFHELFHLRNADQLDVFTRLQPIPFSPLSLGYREYQVIHKGHHVHTATEKDPDAFHIRGGFLKAFIGSLTQQEQAVVRFILEHGLNRELFVLMTIRLCIFLGLLLFFTWDFLLWWLVLRVTYTINDVVFFHIVHYRAGETGTFPLPLPTWLMYLFILIYGTDVVYATMYHDTHHKYSQVAAKHLPYIVQLNESES